jgi:hypothetical protein
MPSTSLRSLAGAVTAALALALAGPAPAQTVTTPPSGGNQRSIVTQGIGLVRVTVNYSSPHVHNPAANDRRGKIWGALVPYGVANLGFGTCGDQCPWRGGANENTVFTTSHDIKVQGEPLPAGTYGLHFVPDKEEWTIIFSKNHTSWGSYFYDAKEDALRVKAKPAKSAEFHEDLTYEFRDRQDDHATAVLRWEDLDLPFTITADANQIYVENMRRELRSSPGFSWQGWHDAAQFCLQRKTNLDEALTWAQHSVDPAQGGQENFASLITLADLQTVTGHAADAKKVRERAFHAPDAGPIQIHVYARGLQAQGKPQEAMEVFESNAKLHPNVWPVHFGLARGHAGLGHRKEAIAEARLALPQAPDPANRKAIEDFIHQQEQEPEKAKS